MYSGCNQRCVFFFMFLLVGGLEGWGGTTVPPVLSHVAPAPTPWIGEQAAHGENTRTPRWPQRWSRPCWCLVWLTQAWFNKESWTTDRQLLEAGALCAGGRTCWSLNPRLEGWTISDRCCNSHWNLTGLSLNFKKTLFQKKLIFVLGRLHAPACIMKVMSSSCLASSLTFILPRCLPGGGTCHGGLLKVNATQHVTSRYVSLFYALLI